MTWSELWGGLSSEQQTQWTYVLVGAVLLVVLLNFAPRIGAGVALLLVVYLFLHIKAIVPNSATTEESQ